jgi:uncharacterized protein DUF6717
MKKFKFIKENTGKWYIDLPEWPGEKWELEMVCGADTMLDIISQGEDFVYLTLSLEPFNVSGTDEIYQCASSLTKINDTPDIGGALYLLKIYKTIEYNIEVWLCHVTEFVFGSMPETIYIA